MTAIPKLMRGKVAEVPLSIPTVFDLTAYYEPGTHFQFSRRVRNQFDSLSREYFKSTWMMGKYGGRARLQTDIQGIGVATRVELGRLAFREDRQPLLRSAFELFCQCQERGLSSGEIDRIVVHFVRADKRRRERDELRRAFAAVFDEAQCSFLTWEQDQLELGRCVVYQSLVQYLREDGPYHSAHRGRIEAVQRHLHQEVGRYENYKFYVRPGAAGRDRIPGLDFCYVGAIPDRIVEAFIEGYTGEHALFVEPESFQVQREAYIELKDYERASRRFGALWILQGDIVRRLPAQQVGVLYLFFNAELEPQMHRALSWDELFARQCRSPYINPAARNSQTFLEMVLEGLVQLNFVVEENGRFQLEPNFPTFEHVTFYHLGEYRKRLQ